MGLSLVHSRARVGARAPAVQVEVHVGGGLPTMSIVGLPQATVREAKDRVRAAIHNAQFEFPNGLGVLAASGQIPNAALRDVEFLGELGLTGELRAVDGVLPATLAAAEAKRRLIVPAANGAEAALADAADVLVARTLLEVCGALTGAKRLPPPDRIATRER